MATDSSPSSPEPKRSISRTLTWNPAKRIAMKRDARSSRHRREVADAPTVAMSSGSAPAYAGSSIQTTGSVRCVDATNSSEWAATNAMNDLTSGSAIQVSGIVSETIPSPTAATSDATLPPVVPVRSTSEIMGGWSSSRRPTAEDATHATSGTRASVRVMPCRNAVSSELRGGVATPTPGRPAQPLSTIAHGTPGKTRSTVCLKSREYTERTCPTNSCQSANCPGESSRPDRSPGPPVPPRPLPVPGQYAPAGTGTPPRRSHLEIRDTTRAIVEDPTWLPSDRSIALRSGGVAASLVRPGQAHSRAMALSLSYRRRNHERHSESSASSAPSRNHECELVGLKPV